MTSSTERIDNYIARKSYHSVANYDEWQEIIDRVQSDFGTNLRYRCVSVIQQSDPLARFFKVFPDGVTTPRRHIKYLELLLADSPTLEQLVQWLHDRGIPTQLIFEDDEDAGLLRIFGYANPDKKEPEDE